MKHPCKTSQERTETSRIERKAERQGNTHPPTKSRTEAHRTPQSGRAKKRGRTVAQSLRRVYIEFQRRTLSERRKTEEKTLKNTAYASYNINGRIVNDDIYYGDAMYIGRRK